MKPLTDVEISRALNALSCTLREQGPASFDASQVEQIALGALAHESKLSAAATGTASGVLHRREDGCLLATIEQVDGHWRVRREAGAGESTWALPQPAHSSRP
jgi:hypothetical protein